MSGLYTYLEGEVVNEAKIGHCTYYGVVEHKYPQYIPSLVVEDIAGYWIAFARPYYKRITHYRGRTGLDESETVNRRVTHYRGRSGLDRSEAIDVINTVICRKSGKRRRTHKINKYNLYREFEKMDDQKDPEHYLIEVDQQSKYFRYLRNCEHLLQKLKKDSSREFDRLGASVIKSLLEIGDERALVFLLEALNSKNKMIWLHAAQGIVELIPKLLIERLEHKSAYVRSSAAAIVGKCRIQDATELLLRVVKGDPDDWVRYEALRSLRLIGDREIIQPIFGLLEEESNEWILSEAVRTCLTFGCKENLGALKKLKEHPNRIVRDIVEKYLATIESVQEKPPITAVANIDWEQEMQSQVLKIICEINDPLAIKTLFVGLSHGQHEWISHVIAQEAERFSENQPSK